MNRLSYLFQVPLILVVSFTIISKARAKAPSDVATENGITTHPHGHTSGRGEGSPEGIASSEFNRRFASLSDRLFGVAELGQALRYPPLIWTRLIVEIVWHDMEPATRIERATCGLRTVPVPHTDNVTP